MWNLSYLVLFEFNKAVRELVQALVLITVTAAVEEEKEVIAS